MISAILLGVLMGSLQYVLGSWEARRILRRDQASDDPLRRAYALPMAVSIQMFAVYSAVAQGALFTLLDLLGVPAVVAIPMFILLALGLTIWQFKREKRITE